MSASTMIDRQKPPLHAMWLACFDERVRHEIWRNELLRRAADPGLSQDDRASAERSAGLHAEKADIYETIMQLLARVEADDVLKKRLRALMAAECAAAAANRPDVEIGDEP